MGPDKRDDRQAHDAESDLQRVHPQADGLVALRRVTHPRRSLQCASGACTANGVMSRNDATCPPGKQTCRLLERHCHDTPHARRSVALLGDGYETCANCQSIVAIAHVDRDFANDGLDRAIRAPRVLHQGAYVMVDLVDRGRRVGVLGISLYTASGCH